EAVAKLVEPRVVREERLVGHQPRDARLRIEDVLEVRTERAVLVGARCHGEEEPVAQRCLLLRVDAERLGCRRLPIVGALAGGRANGGRAWRKRLADVLTTLAERFLKPL